MARDITNFKEAEQRLRDSEEKYRNLVNNITDIILEIDLNATLIYVSPQCFDIVGYMPEEVIGNKAFDYIHPEDVLLITEAIKNGYNSDEQVSVDYRLIHKNGKFVYVSARGRYIGKKRIIGVLHDITKRKEVEYKLKNSEEKLRLLNNELEKTVSLRTRDLKTSETKYRTLFEYSPIPITLLNSEGRILDINSATEKFIGYSKEDLVGKNFIDLEIYPPDIIPTLLYSHKRLKDEETLRANNFKIINREGHETWLNSITAPIKIEEETLFIVMIQDITDLKQAEQKLLAQNLELKELDKLKTDFITIATHELKTPLVSIMGYTELSLIHKVSMTPELKDNLLRIYSNSERLTNHINRLLDVMKIDAKKINLIYEKIALHEFMVDCVSDFNHQIQEKNLKVNFQIDKDLEIEFDSNRMNQALSNLILNAVKYSNVNGSIDISGIIQNENCIIKVKDYGVGLNEDEIGQLFGKFVMLDQDPDTFKSGSGLGLYITKGIIEAHNGKIWVTSEGKGKGSEFCFTLPLKK